MTHTTRDERKKAVKAFRVGTSHKVLARWAPSPDRPDPISLLQAQDQGRVEKLLPIKYKRMLASPFTFYRGSAVLMAADLAGLPEGITVSAIANTGD